ncbi:MAG: alpha-amylase [Deltaproteobacteria bacterium]|nr:alpha-amylase [Deltaproteobacteria bacterium]
MMQYFEWYLPSGVLWKKMRDEAGNLADLGINALWIPPAYKGLAGAEDVGYAVYDLYDLGEFDQKGSVPTKYGTKEELLEAVRAAHAHGIAVYADIVLDHKMGADGTEVVKAEEYNPANRLEKETGPEKIEAATLFAFPARHGKYSDFTWHWYHFTGIDRDESSKDEGIFKFVGKYWEKQVDKENGNYDYLMGASLDLNNKEVCDELKRWGIWFVETTGVDGFRLDAVKHMKFTFHSEWLHAIRSHFHKEFFTVGEYWSKYVSALRNFTATTNDALSLFDVPLHFRFYWASLGGGVFDLRTIFDDTLTAADPVKSVTFVDNHDSQPGQSLESWVRDWFKPHAYALILLREQGYPCIFYGDFYGIDHDGIAPKSPVLIPMLEARRRYAIGKQTDYFDDPNIVGWTREGDDGNEGSGLAVLLSNGRAGSKRMNVGSRHGGKVFIDVTRASSGQVVIDKDGFGLFRVVGASVSIWVREDAAERDLPREMLTANPVTFPRALPEDDIREICRAMKDAHLTGDTENEKLLLRLAGLRAEEVMPAQSRAALLVTIGEQVLENGLAEQALPYLDQARGLLLPQADQNGALLARIASHLERIRGNKDDAS